jgi:hypothetical protein
MTLCQRISAEQGHARLRAAGRQPLLRLDGTVQQREAANFTLCRLRHHVPSGKNGGPCPGTEGPIPKVIAAPAKAWGNNAAPDYSFDFLE